MTKNSEYKAEKSHAKFTVHKSDGSCRFECCCDIRISPGTLKTARTVKKAVPHNQDPYWIALNRPILEAERFFFREWDELRKRHQNLATLEEWQAEIEESHEKHVNSVEHADHEITEKTYDLITQRQAILEQRHAINEKRYDLVQAGVDLTIRATKQLKSRQEISADYHRKAKKGRCNIPIPGTISCTMIDDWHLPLGCLPSDSEDKYYYCFTDPEDCRDRPILVPHFMMNYISSKQYLF